MRRIVMATLLLVATVTLEADDPPDGTELITRIYRMELPGKTEAKSDFGQSVDVVDESVFPILEFLSRDPPPDQPEPQENLFAQDGVTFTDGAFARYWRPLKLLVVRNSPGNLRKIEAVVNRLQPPERQVQIDWQWFETVDGEKINTTRILRMSPDETVRLGPDAIRWREPIRFLVVEGTNAVVESVHIVPRFEMGSNGVTHVRQTAIGTTLSVSAKIEKAKMISIDARSNVTRLAGWEPYSKGNIEARQPVLSSSETNVSVALEDGHTRVVNMGTEQSPQFAKVCARVATMDRHLEEPAWKRDQTTLMSKRYTTLSFTHPRSTSEDDNQRTRRDLLKLGIPFPDGASVSWGRDRGSLTVVNTPVNIVLLDQIFRDVPCVFRLEVGMVELQDEELTTRARRNELTLDDVRRITGNKARIVDIITAHGAVNDRGATQNVTEINRIWEIGDRPRYGWFELGAALNLTAAMTQSFGIVDVEFDWRYWWMVGQEDLSVGDRPYKQPLIAARVLKTTYRARDGDTNWFSVPGSNPEQASAWWLAARVQRLGFDGKPLDRPLDPVGLTGVAQP